MAQVTALDEFFPIQLGVLKEGLPVTFGLFVYLPLNKRIVQLRRDQELLEEGFLALYGNRGIAQLYVAKKTATPIEYIRIAKEQENEENRKAFEELEEKAKLYDDLKDERRWMMIPQPHPWKGLQQRRRRYRHLQRSSSMKNRPPRSRTRSRFDGR